METHWSSEPAGNLTMTLEPVLSSVSFRGRNLQRTGGVAGVVGLEEGGGQEVGVKQKVGVGQ